MGRKKQAESCRHCHRKLTTRERREGRARYFQEPIGYLNWHEWAEEMSKTYRQVECPGCGRYTLWVPK